MNTLNTAGIAQMMRCADFAGLTATAIVGSAVEMRLSAGAAGIA